MNSLDRQQHANEDEVAAAIRDLDEVPHIVHAARWPDDLSDLDIPGLYSWWVDRAGAANLSAGLGTQITEGRIYAGLTGATKWPSGSTGKNTLRKRVGGSHIRGRIRGSTFRLTLASVLREQLGLIPTGPKLLAPRSEKALTQWIRDHLSVAVHRFPADPLADLEHQVLVRLDPPLNLDGMPPNPLRMHLRELRHVLRYAPTTRLSAQIGGGLTGYFNVEGDGSRLTWSGPPKEPGDEERIEEVLAPAEAWVEFWDALDRLEVWKWDEHCFETSGVLDGTLWSLEAIHLGRYVVTEGNNGYPGSSGTEVSRVFGGFCKAVSRLAGGRPFA